MRNSIIVTGGVIGQALAGFDTWSPAGEGEVRAPCPMLNTLANHGFLPHSGKGITELDTENALYDALHINKTLASSLFDFAITTNPVENATTFDLDHLGRHNVLEHDASLSRVDAHFGNQLIFNQTIFDRTKAFFTGDKVDVTMAAKARLARIKDSMANNPEYSMSDLGTAFSFGESVAYIIALGDLETGTAERDRIEFLFEHEKLPLELGWERPKELLGDENLSSFMDKIQNITAELDAQAKVPEGAEGYPRRIKVRGGFHIGME